MLITGCVFFWVWVLQWTVFQRLGGGLLVLGERKGGGDNLRVKVALVLTTSFWRGLFLFLALLGQYRIEIEMK